MCSSGGTGSDAGGTRGMVVVQGKEVLKLRARRVRSTNRIPRHVRPQTHEMGRNLAFIRRCPHSD